MNAPPLIPLDVVKHVLFPFVIELGGLRCVVPLLLVQVCEGFCVHQHCVLDAFLGGQSVEVSVGKVCSFCSPR